MPPDVRLDEGECLLDRIQVRRVRREIKQLDASTYMLLGRTKPHSRADHLLCFAKFSNLRNVVDRAIVHDQYTARSWKRTHVLKQSTNEP
jgi:hypothetical protein